MLLLRPTLELISVAVSAGLSSVKHASIEAALITDLTEASDLEPAPKLIFLLVDSLAVFTLPAYPRTATVGSLVCGTFLGYLYEARSGSRISLDYCR